MANPLIVDGRNLLDPGGDAACRLRLRGHRPTPDVADRRLLCQVPSHALAAAKRGSLVAQTAIGSLRPRRSWKRSSSPAARPSGSVTLRAAGRRRSSRSPGKPLAAYQVGRLANAGVTRVIFACAAGQGASSSRSSRASARRSSPPRSRSGSAAAAGSSSRRAAAGGDRRRVRAERRRARRRRLRRAARGASRRPARSRRSPSRSRSRSSASSTSTTTTSCAAFARAAVRSGSTAATTSSREEAIERFPDRGDHESSTFPGARRREGACAPTATQGSG